MTTIGGASTPMLWTVGRLQQTRRLVSTVHARIGRSEALNAWHDAFHASTEGLLRIALRQRIDPATIDAEIRIAVFTVEGLLTHELEPEQQRTVCVQLAARWPPTRHVEATPAPTRR